MDLPTELTLKAIEVARTLGKVQGVYAMYNKHPLHIVHSDYSETLSVFVELDQVLSSNNGNTFKFIDGDWVHKLNELYKKAVEKK